MQQPNVVLAPRSVYNDIKQKRIQPDVLFYAAVMLEEPTTTMQELENLGAQMDELLYLFESEPADDVEVEGDSPAPQPQATQQHTQDWAAQAQAIFEENIGRDPGIRPHQYDELKNRTQSDLGVITSLAEIIAKNEREKDQIRYVDKFIFKILGSTPLERLQKQKPQQSKIASKVQEVLDSIPDPPEETGPRGGITPEQIEKLKEMNLR